MNTEIVLFLFVCIVSFAAILSILVGILKEFMSYIKILNYKGTVVTVEIPKKEK